MSKLSDFAPRKRKGKVLPTVDSHEIREENLRLRQANERLIKTTEHLSEKLTERNLRYILAPSSGAVLREETGNGFPAPSQHQRKMLGTGPNPFPVYEVGD